MIQIYSFIQDKNNKPFNKSYSNRYKRIRVIFDKIYGIFSHQTMFILDNKVSRPALKSNTPCTTLKSDGEI